MQNVAKGAGKIGRVVTGYEAYDSRKKQRRQKKLLIGWLLTWKRKTEGEEKSPIVCCLIW